ncbi:MAG: hypothetical protein DMG40_24795 [Acidobacteria bacterium]|nr:MAG: hypothetical protein DMG40_24795 [Acidobacteriota bacterium]
MNRSALAVASVLFLLAVTVAPGREQRASLLPKLKSGQALTYLIRYRSTKDVKTESNVAIPLAPAASQTDARGLLYIQILDLQQTGGKPAIQARSQFLNGDAEASAAKPASEKSKSPPKPLAPAGNPVEFTISPEGYAEKVTGLDNLTEEQQQIWQEWVARFAMAWAVPSPRVKIGDNWKIERPERATSPIAALIWTRDSSYVRDEPCAPAQLSITGEVTPSSGATDICAVVLTNAKLVQKSSPKDATPEDFKLHQLKTMGTAKGSNELITYISLTTGLVVRATEEADQQMDVTVAKADGSNGVHYNVDAKSELEVLLLTQAQLPPQPSRH